MLDTYSKLMESDFPAISRGQVETLQVNLGYLCNLSCTHCHVNAGPTRKELMAKETIDMILSYIDRQQIKTLDLTGGAPEMNPHFRYLVSEARSRNVHVMDRCNLTVLEEPGFETTADFLAEHGVEIVASLPCYTQDNVDKQRGKGVFGSSISVLKKLNGLGYGLGNTDKILSLVYNPVGAFLPPPQEALQEDYKQQLKSHFDIEFDLLYTITNMPISRFGSVLLSKGEFDGYMTLLKNAYSKDNLRTVMCRSLISVDWQGYIYDCDFNQMLDLPMSVPDSLRAASELIGSDRERLHLSQLGSFDLNGREITVADHCYGCTAGQGSSCGGALE